jgi:hypothetical protein
MYSVARAGSSNIKHALTGPQQVQSRPERPTVESVDVGQRGLDWTVGIDELDETLCVPIRWAVKPTLSLLL